MARVVIQEIVSGTGQAAAINANFNALAEALELLLSRVGDSPNQMEADIDLNGHVLLNSGLADTPQSLVSLQTMQDYVSAHSSGLVIQKQELHISGNLQTVFTLDTFEYEPGVHNLAVYVDGIRKFTPDDYTETDASTITFTAGLSTGDEVQFVSNEFLGTTIVQAHTHPWAQITNVPVYTTRWPTYAEVTDKPTTFTPSTHQHAAADITSGRLGDQYRGVYVQASQPGSPTLGDLWAW